MHISWLLSLFQALLLHPWDKGHCSLFTGCQWSSRERAKVNTWRKARVTTNTTDWAQQEQACALWSPFRQHSESSIVSQWLPPRRQKSWLPWPALPVPLLFGFAWAVWLVCFSFPAITACGKAEVLLPKPLLSLRGQQRTSSAWHWPAKIGNTKCLWKVQRLPAEVLGAQILRN